MQQFFGLIQTIAHCIDVQKQLFCRLRQLPLAGYICPQGPQQVGIILFVILQQGFPGKPDVVLEAFRPQLRQNQLVKSHILLTNQIMLLMLSQVIGGKCLYQSYIQFCQLIVDPADPAIKMLDRNLVVEQSGSKMGYYIHRSL